MGYQFFSASDYVNQKSHASAIKKTIRGKTDFHTHDFFEIELVLSGSGRHIVNGMEHSLKNGVVYLLSPGTFHRIFCSPELTLLTVMFDESMIENELIIEILTKFQNHTIKMEDEEDFSEITTLANQLVGHIDDKHNYANLYIKNLINCIIIKVIQANGAPEIERSKESLVHLNEAMRYLYNNFKDSPSLKKTASLFGYSPNYFSKAFSDLTGKSYVDFLNALKTMHAKMLLLSTDKTVSEIAFNCGFSSISNFYRVFKKETGLSPLECRKRIP